MSTTVPIHHDTGEDPPDVRIVSQAGPVGTAAWWECRACGRSGRVAHRLRAEAEAEGAAHRCAVPVAGLDNQGRPVHGDQVPYHVARADLLRGGAA